MTLNKKPRYRSTEASVKINKYLQLVSRHSQTVCYIYESTFQAFAVNIAKIIGFSVVASAKLVIKPTPRFTKIVLCKIGPVYILIDITQDLTHRCLLFCYRIFHIYNFYALPQKGGLCLFMFHQFVN